MLTVDIYGVCRVKQALSNGVFGLGQLLELREIEMFEWSNLDGCVGICDFIVDHGNGSVQRVDRRNFACL